MRAGHFSLLLRVDAYMRASTVLILYVRGMTLTVVGASVLELPVSWHGPLSKTRTAGELHVAKPLEYNNKLDIAASTAKEGDPLPRRLSSLLTRTTPPT